MPQPSRQARFGYERKRSNLTIDPRNNMASSSSSAFSRQPYNTSEGFYQGITRTDSPPASAYFPDFSSDTEREPRPAEGADAHFAYSTTLRRHTLEGPLSAGIPDAEAMHNLWQRAVNAVTGERRDHYERLQNGHVRSESLELAEKKDTPSAKFAHCTVEVSGDRMLISYMIDK
jgi:Ca2+-transporting ATPase